jgi:hypothetical protein
MNTILKICAFATLSFLYSCETSEDISSGLDHEVPSCKTLTITANGQTKAIDDNISSLLLWGLVPQNNLETIVLPTVTATKGGTVDISVELSDKAGLKTAELSYANWLFSKYINFVNPEDGTPLNLKTYTFTATVPVPSDAVTEPWLENYYYNDGSSIKIVQSYHKMTLEVVDINMNVRTIPIFVKVE